MTPYQRNTFQLSLKLGFISFSNCTPFGYANKLLETAIDNILFKNAKLNMITIPCREFPMRLIEVSKSMLCTYNKVLVLNSSNVNHLFNCLH